VRTATSTLFFCAAAVARIALAETVVNSTFVGGGDSINKYSNPANWSPAEVPNNSSSKIYDITVALKYVNLDMDATVENLTLIGQTASFYVNGFSYTVTGTATVDANSYLDAFGTFLITGSLSNFDASSMTLSGGRYSVTSVNGRTSSLRFPGADIVNNSAWITLFGQTAAITDTLGRDGLRNFAHNLAGARFSVVARDYTINNVFTNDGMLTVGSTATNPTSLGSSLTIVSLTNYDAQSKRLAGGVFDIAVSSGSTTGIPAGPAQLTVPGADIVHNSAWITLEDVGYGGLGSNPSFSDGNGNNALRNLAENEAAGVLLLQFLPQPFQTNSDFTNEGTVELKFSTLGLPASHVYRQVSGRTTLSGGSITGNVEISGGELFAIEDLNQTKTVLQTPAVNGDLTVGAALLDPVQLRVNGSVLLADTTRFLLEAGRPSRKGLSAQGTLTLAGTLEATAYFPSSTIAHAAAISGVFKNAPNGSRVFTIDGRGSYVVTYTSTDVTLSNYQATAPAPQLLNISTRAQVLTGDRVAIGGFIITGNDWKNVLIRAIGPSLASAGVPAPLQDPVIELHDSKGALMATSDNWPDNVLEIGATNLAPKDARESAIFAVLQPGAYTAIVRGANDTTGTALVEVYDLSSGSPAKLANISTRGFVDPNNVLIGGLIAGGGAQDHVQVVVRAIGAGLQSSGVPNFLPDAALEVRDQNGGLIVANDDFGTPSSNASTVPTTLQPQNPTDAATGLTFAPGQYTVIVHGKNGASGNALVEIYDVTGSQTSSTML
jgi:hypothetical protein